MLNQEGQIRRLSLDRGGFRSGFVRCQGWVFSYVQDRKQSDTPDVTACLKAHLGSSRWPDLRRQYIKTIE